jgi:hypothetical protein
MDIEKKEKNPFKSVLRTICVICVPFLRRYHINKCLNSETWKNAKVRITPQNTAKTNIEKRIFGIGTLKESANNVPPIGVKKRGVKQAMPQMPNLCQILMAKRVLFENSLGFVLRYFLIKILTSKPIRQTNPTIAIIPIIEHIAVSIHVSPRTIPVIGPLKNLRAVKAITVKYLLNGMILGL